MTHSAGGPFGLLVAEARPNLVKATVIIEGAGTAFAGGNRWGLSTIPVTYDPPVKDPSEIKVVRVENPEPDVDGYFLQVEPARKLPNLKNTARADRHGTRVQRRAGQSRPGGVPEAGGREGRRAAHRARRRPARQQPHDDGGEEQPRGAAADPQLAGQERHRQRAGLQEARHRLHGDAPGRHGLLLGGRRAQEDGLRHHRVGADVRPVPDPRADPPAAARSCSCTAAAVRAPTTWASTATPAGRTTTCRPATRCTWWIARATAACRITRTRPEPVGGDAHLRLRLARSCVRAATGTPRRWMGTGLVGRSAARSVDGVVRTRRPPTTRR